MDGLDLRWKAAFWETGGPAARCRRRTARDDDHCTKSQRVSPTPDDVRMQVQRMTASSTFANSPQLAAFLLFVVEAELRGKGERLKGHARSASRFCGATSHSIRRPI